MDAESEYEIKRDRDAIDMNTIQSMIDVSADRLEGLRTQCSTSAELTQQEIRTLEGKLVKHFSRQLVLKARIGEELRRELADIPNLAQWLRVVGLSQDSINMICSRVRTLESLRERSDYELRSLLAAARDEEQRRLCRAMQRLRAYTEALGRGEGGAELQLYWDSWERHGGRGSPRGRTKQPRANAPTDSGLDSHHSTPQGKKGKPTSTPVDRRGVAAAAAGHLPAPAALTKSRSHESQLSVRPDASDLSDNSQSSAVGTLEGTPPASPHDTDTDSTPIHKIGNNTSHHNSTGSSVSVSLSGPAPRSPRTPTVGRCMAHDIAHRFTKTFNMIATCDYCEKQILFGSGLKCKECKFKCHRDCEAKVPPSCGLPQEFVNAFKEKFHKDAGNNYYMASPQASRGFLTAFRNNRRHHMAQPYTNCPVCPDSSSNTSSCNSSTPSSPALCAGAVPPTTALPPATTTLPPATTALPAASTAPHTPHHHHHHAHKPQFHFPEVKPAVSSPNHTNVVQSPKSIPEHKEDLTASVRSDNSRCLSLSGSGSTDSGGAVRGDSLDLANKDNRWPRQNSLSMKEWDIPYDELKLFEVIGRGRFGTVYRGSWHGAVAVKLLHVHATTLGDHCVSLDTFKHEVATFRKTRHENLVLFMGACMKPPRLAIVTSLCKGNTLYTHIHLRKDKFTANKSVIVAQQISQGMGYLHARGIIHKDLKTKNIFLENGKVVITDFGLFSVTKLCFGNNARGDSLGIPPGWLCYLAPELIRALRPHASLHLPFSKATDVYAFGTVWYELLCGEYPFKGQPPEAVIWQVGKGVKQSLANMQASRDIKDILMQCWSYRGNERADFPRLLSTLQKLPRKRLARSPSHPVHLSRSADSVF